MKIEAILSSVEKPDLLWLSASCSLIIKTDLTVGRRDWIRCFS